MVAMTEKPDGACISPDLRHAKADDVGIVHRVVVTWGSEGHGYVLTHHSNYNLFTWSPVRPEHIRIEAPCPAESLTIRITTVSLREPRVGDKFASRHGQKGTVGGILMDCADLPYTMDGTVPDILFNAHGIPSRMTMGQMWESLLGKLNALVGYHGRFTNGATVSSPAGRCGVPFTGVDVRSTNFERLLDAGYPRMGREQLYSGETAERLDGLVYIGCVFYQRLSHMVADKVRARSMGPVSDLVRQPTEGRARQGGLRIGEMERDCLIAHGASALMQERLLHKSDAYRMALCARCGRATCHTGRECAICHHEGELRAAEAVGVVVPYSFKLLLQARDRSVTTPTKKNRPENHRPHPEAGNHRHGHRLATGDGSRGVRTGAPVVAT